MTGSRGNVWRRTGWYVVPETDRELMSFMGALGVYSKGVPFAWRGMSSADFPVVSSLSRALPWNATEETVAAAEDHVLARARAWGLGISAGRQVSDLELLADLQHYGVATRLVDFTSNPMTALWFACQDPRTRLRRSMVLHPRRLAFCSP
ncbi:FRG domain-containing protein [Leifsonia xyli]|uniref:FRG domain-containing protein n=1 Tax=Leifsonia xyli TaxID=1575 RepID=UPI003D67D917